MISVATKLVFRVSVQVRHKPDCTAVEDGLKLLISHLESNHTIDVAKKNVLISCMFTSQLICAFVSTYAESRFSCVPDEKIQVNPRFWSGSDPDVLTL